MGNQNKRTADIEQTNQIAEWRELRRSVNEPRSSGGLRISDMTLMGPKRTSRSYSAMSAFG
jgi:hypothetical protein